MKIFSFDPDDHRDDYARDEWVHVRGGLSDEFLAYLRDYTQRRFLDHRVEGKAIGGRKNQAIFEPPDDVDFPGELFDAVAALCGLRRETMTLSERHIKAYDADAPAEVPAHKDRFASQVSIGFSVDIPRGSKLVLYPFEHREVNPFNVSAALRQSLEPHQLPEVILKDAREVVIEDAPGDVVMFPGSSLWHYRRNQAGAVLLYLKLNDFGSDPLGEDPATPGRREATLAALSNGGLGELVPALSRRLDTVTRQYTRDPRVEALQANVWDEPPIALDQDDFEVLQAIDAETTVDRLAERSARASGHDAVHARIRRLAQRGAVDLLAPS